MKDIENFSLASPSTHERELTLTIPIAVVSKEFELALKNVQRVASRPGFRPGKIPANMVMNFYRAEINKKLTETLIDKSFDDACKNQELIPVSKPQIEPISEIGKEKPFTYKALFQIKPKVIVSNFEKLNIDIKKYVFSEQDISDELNSIRESQARFVEPERDIISAEDLVDCDSEVVIDGVVNPKFSHQDYSVPLFALNVPEDLRSALIGKQVGEKAMVKYTMPTEHQEPELAGKECEMLLTIKSFKERQLPLLDDEFAKDLSEQFTKLDDVKEAIKLRFTITAKRRNEYYRQEAITKALVENNPVDVPPAMIERMAMSLINRELETMKESVAQEVVKNHWQELWQSVQGRALFRAQAELLLEELIKKLNVQASDEEVAERIKKIKEISREDAAYSLQVEKVINALEQSANINVVEEPLFSQGN